MKRQCFWRFAALLICLLPTALAQAALPDAPHKDIHYIAEHLGEAAQDMRYFALAWPSQPLEPGRWTGGVSVGSGEANAEFLRVKGELISAEAFHFRSGRNGLALQAFYDSFEISGAGEQVLRAPFAAGVPLDLPERIEVTKARGEVSHFGVGMAWLHELSREPSRGWCLNVGALVERLELDGFELDFLLLGGRDTGTRGVLDHSSSGTYVTPYVGLLRRLPLGRSLALTPRFAVGAPLPKADFDGRLTGPGFDLSSRDQGGSPGQMGDGFLMVGAGLVHRPSGLEIELGGALFYPLFEKTTHPRVDRSILLVVRWRLP